MPCAFPPAARLHRPSEYAAALRGQRLARGALFVLTGAKRASGDGPRLGLVVPKRHAPLAVTRNTIKRVLREAFRHQRACLPAQDIVFRLTRRAPTLSLTALKRQVRAEADTLLSRITSC